MKAKLLGLIIAFSISFISTADEEKDIYAVTLENCGDIPLETCAKSMEWAKKRIEASKTREQVHRENIARMHEEALEVLGEDTKEASQDQ